MSKCPKCFEDVQRLEKGYKYFTADITSQEDPYSAGLGFCVKMDKGDFIGRSALEKINREGIIQRLSTMVLEGECGNFSSTQRRLWLHDQTEHRTRLLANSIGNTR